MLDHEIDEFRTQLQRNKQEMVKMKEAGSGDQGVESLRPAEVSNLTTIIVEISVFILIEQMLKK